MALSAKAKTLRFGHRLGVIAFGDRRWWVVDMTGQWRGPVTRRQAYLVAVSYMDAQEVASHAVPQADVDDPEPVWANETWAQWNAQQQARLKAARGDLSEGEK